MVKNAVSRRRRSPGRTIECSYASKPGDHGDPEPVEDADVEPDADGGQQHDRAKVEQPCAPEDAALAEANRHRLKPLLTIDVQIEQRVEEVEARDPERDRAAEGPGLPRQLALDRSPGADRRQAVDGPEPQVAEPRPALQVRVDHEPDDGDRPEPVHQRVELVDGNEEQRERAGAEEHHLRLREQPRRELAPRRARVARVQAGVDQAVQSHRQRAGTDHRDRDPEQVVRARGSVHGEERPDVRERQREDRVLELDERVEPPRIRDQRSCLACARSACRPGARPRAPAPAAAPRSRRGSRRASREGSRRGSRPARRRSHARAAHAES